MAMMGFMTFLAVVARCAGGHDLIAPAMAEGCIQHPTTPGIRCRTPPPGCPETSGQSVSLQWTGFLWHLRYQNLLGPGRPYASMPSGAGSAVVLPDHMVRSVEGVGPACLEHLAEKHWGSTLEITTNVV